MLTSLWVMPVPRILGFCNNFTYWVLITAAVDILARTGAPVSEPFLSRARRNVSNASHVLWNAAAQLTNELFTRNLY